MVPELIVAVEPWATARHGVMNLWPMLAAEAVQSERTPLPEGDRALYDGAAANDGLICVTARKERVVGFWLAFLAYHPHHRGHLSCAADLVFIHPEHRGSMTAARMFRAMRDEARERGASVFYANSPIGRDLGPIFRRFGLAPVETQYSVWF